MIRRFSIATLLSITVSVSSLETNEFVAPPVSSRIAPPPNSKAQTASYQEALVYKKPKNSFVTMGLSAFFPGLGNAYLGDYRQAAGLAGTFGAGVGISEATGNMSGSIVATNTWFYGMYSAYRDLRNYNGEHQYKYKMANESLTDLALAPFQVKVMKKPEVWGGILGGLAVGGAVSYLVSQGKTDAASMAGSTSALYPLAAFPVGIGEEAFFRGYLQPAISEVSNPTAGWISSSVLFGAAHIPNANNMSAARRQGYYRYVVPFITAFGLYEGWLAQKNHSLKEAVAVHAWYDFIIFLGSAAASGSIKEAEPKFSITFTY